MLENNFYQKTNYVYKYNYLGKKLNNIILLLISNKIK